MILRETFSSCAKGDQGQSNPEVSHKKQIVIKSKSAKKANRQKSGKIGQFSITFSISEKKRNVELKNFKLNFYFKVSSLFFKAFYFYPEKLVF